MSRFAVQSVSLAVLLFASGCGENAPPATPEMGARLAAENFYGGLIAGDDLRAYGILDPMSKRGVSTEQFAVLTRAYLKKPRLHRR